MLRSAYAGAALTTVMLIAMPLFGNAEAGHSSSAGSSAPVVVASGAGTANEPATASLIEFIERAQSADERDEASGGDDAARPASGSSASGASSGSGVQAAGAASAQGADSSPGAAGSSSGGGTAAPSTPAPPPEPEPPACPAAIGGSTPGAPGASSPLGVAGTTSADLQSFAAQYNAIRVTNCLPPVPFSNIRYDSCMEQRLFWMAEDPSEDPMSAWGHIGSVRSDGVPSVGCDGNLAGGSGNTGATVADKWWNSGSHRASLYKPSHTGSTANVCVLFAMTHGGVPNEPYSFTRAAARWVNC